MGLLQTIRLIGVGNALRAVGNAVDHVWQDLGHPRPGGAERSPGALTEATSAPGGARFAFEAATLRVRLLAGGGVFVAWDTGGGVEPTPSYAVVDAATTTEPHADATLREDGADWLVAAGELVVRVSPAGAVQVATAAGGDPVVLREDRPPRWRGDSWSQSSELAEGAHVFGLGGRSGAPDLRGRSFRLWSREPGGSFGPETDPLSITMPVYLVVGDDASHLVFYDATYDGTVDVGTAEVRTALDGGPLRYYVCAGPPAAALDRYTQLTGRPALPPRWALGYHQSRWGYGDQKTLGEIVDGFRKRDLPLSGLWLDIDHMDGHRVFTVDERNFPDLPGLAGDLAETDTHLVAIVDPAVKREPGQPLFDAGVAAGHFATTKRGGLARGVAWPGWVAYPDFTSPRARAWWSEQYAGLVERGIEGCWHDMNEPSSFTAFGEPTLPRSTRHDLEGRGGDHDEAHNVYGLLMNRAGHDGMAAARPEHRPYLITRAGWAGLQRYSGTWSGDIETSWAGLRASLSFTLGLGACGVPYSGPDIGGFTAHPSPELYVRWFQLAAYLPFFRTHCGHSLPPREPWEHGAEPLEHAAAQLRERYRLLPYWYSLAWQAHRTGAPYVRPLWWTDPGDRELRGVDDTFLLGDALLVAPVFTEGARTRTVRLPAGRWYDRRDGRAYDGPTTVTVEAPLGELPVFARGGAVVPVEENGAIVLEAYLPEPDAGGGAVRPANLLVTDAGDGYAEPTEERFTVRLDAAGAPTLDYAGPETEQPYEVRWLPAAEPERS